MPKLARVLFDYTAEAENELDLSLGDIVTILQEDESGWSKGEIDGKSGWFPSSYYEPCVEETQHVPQANQQPQITTSERLKRRYEELVTTEKAVASQMTELLSKLESIKGDKRWMLDDANERLLLETSSIIFRLRALHESLAAKLTYGIDESTPLINPAFVSCESEMVELHANYQFKSSCVIFVLQKKAGGKVVGDKAVGTIQRESGTLGAALWELQVIGIPARHGARGRPVAAPRGPFPSSYRPERARGGPRHEGRGTGSIWRAEPVKPRPMVRRAWQGDCAEIPPRSRRDSAEVARRLPNHAAAAAWPAHA